MTRRDTIIIAVLVNVGLLAILFAAAITFDTDHIDEQPYVGSAAKVENGAHYQESPLQTFAADGSAPLDEIDTMLSNYTPPSSGQTLTMSSSENVNSITPQVVDVSQEIFNASSIQTVSAPAPAASAAQTADDVNPSYVEITVKRGDSLDKIARANGTSIETIRQLNHLNSDRLDIGQVLRVPLSNTRKAVTVKKETPAPKKVVAQATKDTNTTTDGQYYTIKSGDNPWKIARQFHVKFEDLLKMNGLNEEKARNLKVGDKIRVK